MTIIYAQMPKSQACKSSENGILKENKNIKSKERILAKERIFSLPGSKYLEWKHKQDSLGQCT